MSPHLSLLLKLQLSSECEVPAIFACLGASAATAFIETDAASPAARADEPVRDRRLKSRDARGGRHRQVDSLTVSSPGWTRSCQQQSPAC